MNSRLIKILFSCAAALYILLVCMNNITDYRSNFTFVSKVAEMEDTFSIQNSGWRSVHNVFLHHLFFVIIILWEAGIAICLLIGATNMMRKFCAAAGDFRKAKYFSTCGFALGVM